VLESDITILVSRRALSTVDFPPLIIPSLEELLG